MSSPINSIIRAATRKSEPLNILLFTSDEEYESLLCNTKHNFFALNNRNMRWRNDICSIPENYNEITSPTKSNITFDLVLCLGRYRNYRECRIVSQRLHIPLVLMELDYPQHHGKTEKGDLNIFINDHQAKAWNFKKEDCILINNCIDERKLTFNVNKDNTILTVENDWRKKSLTNGFGAYWKLFSNTKLPIKIVGNNPGISKNVHWQEECELYNESGVYVNTSLKVAQPTQILKAMYTGSVVIALDNCGMDEIIKHKKTGLLVKETHSIYILKYIEVYKNNPEWSKKLGLEAHRYVSENHSIQKFVNNWNKVFEIVKGIKYTGNYES